MDAQQNECSLMQKTRGLLQGAERNYLDIYQSTGLTPNWLSQFARGRIADPSVNKVQRLYEHLTGKKLSV